MAFSIRRTRELGTVDTSVPAGAVMPFAGNTSPAGWLLCFGQDISRTEYSALFSVLGTSYGSGNGSTTFNLPDLRGRVVAGVDNMGGTAASRLTSTTITGGGDAPGEVGGGQTHTLTGAESGVPAHGHTTGNNSVDHSHFISAAFDNVATAGPYPYYARTGGGSTLLGPPNGMTSAGQSSNHTHVVNNNTAANASSAHNNVQPTMVLNYIIKA
jgi:microcystin-dependent protein